MPDNHRPDNRPPDWPAPSPVPAPPPAAASDADNAAGSAPTVPPREHGGRAGPDPTRYLDWERGGRCIDF